MKQYTKAEAIEIVVSCAEKYSAELLDRSLLFVCQNQHKKITCIEVFFYDRNFLHLTGLKLKKRARKDSNGDSAQNAKDFFENCLSHTVSPKDFDFAADGTTPLKLEILPYLISKNLSAKTVGDFYSLRPRLYTEKLAGSNKGCMGFRTDDITNNYVPNTVLNEDIKYNVRDWARVIAVYRKGCCDDKYSEITYLAKNVDWDSATFPEEYSYLPKPQPSLSN